MVRTHAFAAELANDKFRSGDYEQIVLKQMGTADESTVFLEMDATNGYAAQDCDSSKFGTASTDGTIANTAAFTYSASGGGWAAPAVGTAIKRKSDGQITDAQQFSTPKTLDGAGDSLVLDIGAVTGSEA